MQLTGDLKPVVSVAAQQGMYFNQQQTQNQAGPSANQADTYCSVSQSQTINFTQQSLRQRAAAAGGVPQPGAAGPGTRGHPQQVPPVQVDQHQHAKLLQQQQLMRAQQVSDLNSPYADEFLFGRSTRVSRASPSSFPDDGYGVSMVTRVDSGTCRRPSDFAIDVNDFHPDFYTRGRGTRNYFHDDVGLSRSYRTALRSCV